MHYFPDPVSGWCFLAALAAVLGVASYTDERFTTVPKWLTVPALGLGLALSVLRGALLGGHGQPVWVLGQGGPTLGALDGLLFALAGFAAGFALFFALWVLGACGGGDVKLFAAIGAWIGPYLLFMVLLVSLVLLTFCLAGILALRLVRGRRVRVAGTGGKKAGLKTPVVIRFSVVAALATLLVVVWAFRIDLGLARPLASAPPVEVSHHAP